MHFLFRKRIKQLEPAPVVGWRRRENPPKLGGPFEIAVRKLTGLGPAPGKESEPIMMDEPREQSFQLALRLQLIQQPMPIPIIAQLALGILSWRSQVASLDLHSGFEAAAVLPLKRDEELGASEIDVTGNRFGQAIGLGEKRDPLPVHPTPPAGRDKSFPEAGLQRRFEYPRDPLVWLKIADANASLKIDPLDAKIRAGRQAKTWRSDNFSC